MCSLRSIACQGCARVTVGRLGGKTDHRQRLLRRLFWGRPRATTGPFDIDFAGVTQILPAADYARYPDLQLYPTPVGLGPCRPPAPGMAALSEGAGFDRRRLYGV